MKKGKLRTVYLFGDGHAVGCFEQDVHGTTVRYCEAWEKWGPQCMFEGRLILEPGFAWLVSKATGVQASEPSVSSGSDATKKLGLAVSTLWMYTPLGPTLLSSTPDVMSADWRHQPNVGNGQTYAQLVARPVWGDTPIVKFHPAKKQAVEQAA